MMAGSTKVIVICGSERDGPFVSRITGALSGFGVAFETRVFSAHKTPFELLAALNELEERSPGSVYITVAGRSNALSGMVDAAVTGPVIACPPDANEKDVWSSLRMPSSVAPMVVLEPENAALAAAKILSSNDLLIREKVRGHQQEAKRKVLEGNR